MSPPTLIDFHQFINNRSKDFIYVKDIKYTLKYYNLDCKGKKKELLDRLKTFFNKLNEKNVKYNSEIIIIQKYIRGYLARKKIKNKDYFFRHKCLNDEDFYTFESIESIDPLYFFSFSDSGFSYYFDIRSFHKLIKSNPINPYTREPIPNSAIEKFNLRYNEIKDNKNYSEFELPEVSEEQKFKNYVIEVFQKIDETDCVAGGTNTDWFYNLSQYNLLKFYKILEDIWFYRASLTYSQMREIVPQENMFKNDFNKLVKNKHFLSKSFKRKIEYIILKEMEKLVSSSPNPIHRSTGAYYVLTALVEVSVECAESMPWLIQ